MSPKRFRISEIFWPGSIGLILFCPIIAGLVNTLWNPGRGAVLDVIVIAELFFKDPGMFADEGRLPRTGKTVRI